MADSTDASPSWMPKAGMALTALASLPFLPSAFFKLTHAPPVMQGLVHGLGMSTDAVTAIGVVELACVALYLFPRTAVLGATLLSAYLGGAVVVHVLQHQPVFLPIIIGVLVWGGIWGREPRLRALTPLRA